MAATKRNPMKIQKARDAIRITQLMNRLVDHGFGKVDLGPTQVQAINIVLKKLKPDLANIAHTGEDGGPIQVTWSGK